MRADHGAIDPRFILDPPTAASDANVLIADAAHSDDIRSFVLTDDRPMGWEIFARSIEMLMALRGADLLRVKGFLNVRGCKGPVVVQVVGHLAHPPIELQGWPDDDHRTRVVFITRGVSESQVKDLVAAAKQLAQP
jgi:G3E family GTPase